MEAVLRAILPFQFPEPARDICPTWGSEIESLADDSFSSRQHGGHCCPLVINPYTWLALVGGVALATYFLRAVIIVETFTGRSFGEDWGVMELMGESATDK